MPEKTEDTAETTIFTNFVDVFGKKNVIELQLDENVLSSLYDDNILISPVYIQADTPHQAKLALVNALVTTATRMGKQRAGVLAVKELARQREGEA